MNFGQHSAPRTLDNVIASAAEQSKAAVTPPWIASLRAQ
jgi:hypothetical protein